MYKILLTALLIAFFAGCSAPKPKTPPTWYTSPPQDFNYFYAVGAADEEIKARNIAILSLRELLAKEMITAFDDPNHRLGALDKNEKAQLAQSAKHIANTLSMRNVELDKSEEYDGYTLVLVKIARKSIFDAINKASQNKFEILESKYKALESKKAIEQYSELANLLDEYHTLASSAQLKESSISTYRADKEFSLLKSIKERYEALRSNISFYVLSDANSIAFITTIKDAITKTGLEISKKPKSKEALTLLMSSITEQSMDYSFMKSKTLITFKVYDLQKNEIASRQHTIIGKSRKSYLDAKIQSAKSLQSIIHKMGIFNILGLEEKK
ncbi:MAG: hypothetical protein J7J31_02655 [Helicobacteraceae bacterium]|nr:hypothetical protein [Helicobacteraceae bacterium]